MYSARFALHSNVSLSTLSARHEVLPTTYSPATAEEAVGLSSVYRLHGQACRKIIRALLIGNVMVLVFFLDSRGRFSDP